MNVSHPVRQALIATVVSIAFALSTATVGANPLGDDTQPFALYVSTNQGQAYQPIDPMALTDLDSASALMFDHDWPELAVSADGSTFVIIEPSRAGLDQWIAVRDGIGGAVRQTITPTEAVYGPRLNADGSRVVVRAPHADPCGPGGYPAQTWHTYDTSTGDLMATIRANDGDPLWPDLIDPAGERLYYPFYDRQASSSATANDSSGPWPLQIAAFDLDTGQEAATMTVPGVSAGSWQAESIDQMYVGEMELPAVTLSPDGSRLAVIDAALETLTLLDAGTLAVQETHAIHRSESLTDRLLGWLGLERFSYELGRNRIATVGKPPRRVRCGDRGQRRRDRVVQGLAGARSAPAQGGLERAERLFDRGEVRRVRRQPQELAAPRFNAPLGIGALVHAEVVPDHHLARFEARSQDLVDEGIEGAAVDRPLPRHRRRDPVETERGDQRRVRAVVPGHRPDHPLPTRRPAIARGHGEIGSRLIDEHEGGRINLVQGFPPGGAPNGITFRRVEDFF